MASVVPFDVASVKESEDQLVKHVVYYNPKPLMTHGYMAPFVLVYLVLGGLLLTRYQTAQDVDDLSDIFIAVSVMVVLQILVFLSSLWSVHCRCFLAFSKVSNVRKAFCAKVVPTANNGSPELVRLATTDIKGKPTIWFMFQKTKYVYDEEQDVFKQIAYPANLLVSSYQNWKGYKTEEELVHAEKLYGKNNLEMDIPEFKDLFKERATAPFFVFQVFCVALWCLDEFWYYSLFTLFMLVAFESILVQQQLRNMAEIRKMGNKPYNIQVYRNRKWRQVLTSDLIPGDIVSIGRSQEDDPVPCDLIIMRGSCIVDESMLTGESVPQMKEAIETILENDRLFNIDSTDGKLHMLYGGTKILQHTPPTKDTVSLRAPDNGCIGYVLRTSFNTSQGKLLRTILYGVQRVTANNLETFAFILFLLIFAIAAAAYVWRRGSLDPKRNKYKLMLECTLILTSVVPPELPIELSLAVNSSLASLIKLFIFCTEPFRIPFAGKVDICCFDKTGTLTSNDFLVEGIAGLKKEDAEGDQNPPVIAVRDAPVETIQVLATCHSLVQLEDGLVGDPLEKATLSAIDWTLTKGDAVIPIKKNNRAMSGLKIFHRNHFSSALKRMSVIAGYGTSDTTYFSAVKGAPEVLELMFAKVPDNYKQVYLEMSRQGARVLALGHKTLGRLTFQEARDLKREEIEKDLEFVGFLIISCPLKPDSKAVAKELLASSHYLTMITGDAPLTACHVAKELYFIDERKPTLILNLQHKELKWISIDEKIKLDLIPTKAKKFFQDYNICVTGDTLNCVLEQNCKFFPTLLPHVRVFARVAPKQKEIIITSLRALGFYTLMCGDGTNDVGALKHAHVGVALISENATQQAKSAKALANIGHKMEQIKNDNKVGASQAARRTVVSNPTPSNVRNLTASQQRLVDSQARLQKLLAEVEEQEKAAIVKLGDASIAAPFTSKLSSIKCICDIIRQGRCTLVTTLQMFKILALNALILAYCQSVLYLDGIKFSDGQATLQGLFLTGCFLFITRSKPLNVLSSRRPLPNIFNFYTILTVLLQFGVHFFTLFTLVQEATRLSPPRTEEFPDLESEFKPSLLNSTVYIISVCLQVSTFAVNYKGHPFMCSLNENKPLLYSILSSFGLVILLVTGVVPDIAHQFSVVEFPEEFQSTLFIMLSGDLAMALIIDRVCEFLFGRTSLRKI